MVEGLGRDSSRILDTPTRPEGGDDASNVSDEQEMKESEKTADDFLVEAVTIAAEIERPIWRNLAFVRTAVVAGESKQFDRALKIARDIENRRGACAGVLARRRIAGRAKKDEAATESYSQVAQAIARVRQDGLRGVLTGFLVDSLISTGRFEDARACLVLYPTESERFVALEAIAEQQGRRGRPRRPREWIAREARPSTGRPSIGGSTTASSPRSATSDPNMFGGAREGLPAPGASVETVDPAPSSTRGRLGLAVREEGGVPLLGGADSRVDHVDVGGQDEEPAAPVAHPARRTRALGRRRPRACPPRRKPGRSSRWPRGTAGSRNRRARPRTWLRSDGPTKSRSTSGIAAIAAASASAAAVSIWMPRKVERWPRPRIRPGGSARTGRRDCRR